MPTPGELQCAMHFKLLLLLCLSSIACASQDNEPEAQALNVSSFNIRYGTAKDGQDHWDMRKQHVLTTIRAEQPHLLGLQEALSFQVDYLAENLPQFRTVGIGRGGGDRGEFSCLFVDERRLEVVRSGTFWLSEQPTEVASRGWDAALPRICTWAVLRDRTNAAEFLWMNTHFDHVGQLARERSGALIHARLAKFEGLPAIVTGDLNAGEESAPLIALKGDRFRDSFRVLHPDAIDVGTFSSFTGRKDGRKIDYVLCSPEWTVLEASIDRREFAGRNPSDHFPVTAKLRL